MYVQNNQQSSPVFQGDIGVKQGGPLSPRLFSAYMEGIVNELKNKGVLAKWAGKETGAILYADDLLVMTDTAAAMRKALRICEEYGRKWEIAFNPLKTELMREDPKKKNGVDNRFNPLPRICMSKKKLGYVEKFKYLGVIISDNFSKNEHLDERHKKITQAYYSMASAIFKSRATSLCVKSALYKAICRPTHLYGIENFRLRTKEAKTITTGENNLVKRMSGLSTRTRVLHALSIEPVPRTIQRAKINFFNRLQANKYTCSLIQAALEEKISDQSLLSELQELVKDIAHVARKSPSNAEKRRIEEPLV